ncbi:MAG: DUF4142 domain-containing protein [Steroidobacteraceae bacterium]
MSKLSCLLAGAMLVAIPTFALAAPAITDNEEHVFRGFFDRQSGIVPVHKLALEKGSADVKTFAQSELDMISSFATDLSKLADKFGLITRGMKAGDASPKLGQGTTRGFDKLPDDGATWFSKGVNPLSGGMPGMPTAAAGGAAPQGGAPAGAPPAGAAPGGAPAGMGAAPAGGGNRQTRYDYDLADLQKLSGADFDKAYLLRVSIAHNAQIRHISNELSEPGANADLINFAKASLKTLAAQNSKIESLLSGQGLGRAPGGEGGAAPGGAAGMGAGGAPAAR